MIASCFSEILKMVHSGLQEESETHILFLERVECELDSTAEEFRKINDETDAMIESSRSSHETETETE